MTEKRDDGSLEQLLERLQLERLDSDLWLGPPEWGEGRMFGGFVAAQAVAAAYQTVEDVPMHSLHAYFLRPGKRGMPVRHVIYRIRDGRSFTTRNVVSYQDGEAIFNLSASFARPEEGMSHQEPAPVVPPPEELEERMSFGPQRPPPERLKKAMPGMPIAVKAVPPVEGESTPERPVRRMWMDTKGELPDDPVMHAALIAYISDLGMLTTVPRKPEDWMKGFTASLDHAMWFHRAPRFDDWLLYTNEAPVSHSARALVYGTLHNRAGELICSVAQEGLVRAAQPGRAGEFR